MGKFDGPTSRWVRIQRAPVALRRRSIESAVRHRECNGYSFGVEKRSPAIVRNAVSTVRPRVDQPRTEIDG
ncbi:hypothetical protein EA472_17390 [Natrarchaeobius oligotrophus]|uniref:Uncharacterized protein n=1 Tax=Natrarchaeobius chitinivorans TaxID=1679083 RepID=A0A3N6M8C4_NATCH|nr:hypothetical protein EA472_17390 [Natrarchaeobius chitinivorans]